MRTRIIDYSCDDAEEAQRRPDRVVRQTITERGNVLITDLFYANGKVERSIMPKPKQPIGRPSKNWIARVSGR